MYYALLISYYTAKMSTDVCLNCSETVCHAQQVLLCDNCSNINIKYLYAFLHIYCIVTGMYLFIAFKYCRQQYRYRYWFRNLLNLHLIYTTGLCYRYLPANRYVILPVCYYSYRHVIGRIVTAQCNLNHVNLVSSAVPLGLYYILA